MSNYILYKNGKIKIIDMIFAFMCSNNYSYTELLFRKLNALCTHSTVSWVQASIINSIHVCQMFVADSKNWLVCTNEKNRENVDWFGIKLFYFVLLVFVDQTCGWFSSIQWAIIGTEREYNSLCAKLFALLQYISTKVLTQHVCL